MSYPGGKAAPGVYQRIINQIPPHQTFIEPFAGDAAVSRAIRPADRTILVDLDHAQLRHLDATFERPGRELHLADGIPWLKHFAGLFALHRPKWDDSIVAYLDPPYPMKTRKGGRIYRYEMTDEQHDDLLNVAADLPFACLISSYPNQRYDETLADWRTIDFQTTDRGGNRRTERLYMNFPEPAELHDYRYLGDDKRQRERIARRRRNWLAGLKRASPLERRAILDACQQAVGEG